MIDICNISPYTIIMSKSVIFCITMCDASMKGVSHF